MKIKILLVLIVLILSISQVTASEVTIELSLDKENYKVGETIHVTINVESNKSKLSGSIIIYEVITEKKTGQYLTLFQTVSCRECAAAGGVESVPLPFSDTYSRQMNDIGRYYVAANFGGGEKKVFFSVSADKEEVNETEDLMENETIANETINETIEEYNQTGNITEIQRENIAEINETNISVESPEKEVGVCRIGDDVCGEEFTPTPENGKKIDNCICMTFFYSPTCEHCHMVDAFLIELEKKYPQLSVTKFNVVIRENAELKEAFDMAFNVPEENRAYVPAMYIGDKYFIGDDPEAKGKIEDEIKKHLDTGLACSCEKINEANPGVEAEIIERFKSFGILAVMFAGLIDGVNPCAFAALVFFVSYLAITGRKGKDILLIGISFTAAIFITYLLIGLGIFKFLHSMDAVSDISKLIYPVAGLLALILAIYSFLDYQKARTGKTKEMVLQLPESVKQMMHAIIRKQVRMKYFTVIAFFTGVLVSLFEFLCTGQVYLPTIIYIMGMPELRVDAFLYLVLYNIMFILPLIAIFLLAYFGTTSRELSGIVMKHTPTIKILTALLFFILAGYMFLITLRMFGL